MTDEKEQPEPAEIDESVEDMVDRPIPEDPFLTEYMKGVEDDQEKDDPVNVTSDWVGKSDNWKVKSNLTAQQIIALTQVREMVEVWDELEPIQDTLERVVQNVEQYVVSHEGMSRDQHVDVLRAMHAQEGETEETKSAIVEAFAAGSMAEDES